MAGGEMEEAANRAAPRNSAYSALNSSPSTNLEIGRRTRADASRTPAASRQSGLRRQPHPVWPNQPGVGRLEFVDRSADGTFHVDILVVLTAERKVRGRGITIWQRHITDDEATGSYSMTPPMPHAAQRLPCTS